MKKSIIWLLVGLICSTMGLFACGSTSAPAITSETTSIEDCFIGDEVTIPTVTATDEIDGDITANVTVKVVTTGKTVTVRDGKFVPTESGSYTIVYTVKNSSGKSAQLEIPVTVKDKIVIGWDARTSSGLTAEIIDNFSQALNTFLNENYQGAKVVFRRYYQETINAVELGNMINSDGDCDILLGFGTNLNVSQESSGSGVVTLNRAKVAMAGKVSDSAMRYVYITTSTNIANDVYNWITSDKSTALTALDLPTVSIAYNSTITALTEDIIANFTLAAQAVAGYKVTVTGYATYGEAKNSDILIGFENVENSAESVTISDVEGVSAIDRLSTKASAVAIFTWLQTEDALGSFKTPEPETYNLVVGWWSYYATKEGDKSGLTATIVDSYVSALKKYLISTKGYTDLTVTVVEFNDSSAALMGDSIRKYNKEHASAPIDYMLGVGQNFNLSTGANITTASMKGVYKINNVSNRYFASIKKLTDCSQLVNDAMDWTISEDGLATLGTVTKTD